MVRLKSLAQKQFDWFGALLILSSLQRAFFQSSGDVRVRSDSAKGFRNYRRIDSTYRILRLFFALLLLLILPFHIRNWIVRGTTDHDLILLCVVGTVIFNFLEACDPQTPRHGRIREFLSSLGSRLLPIKAQ